MSDIPPDQQAFGARLAAARGRAALTQPAVATWLTNQGVDCSKQAVSAWEAGRNMPNPLVLRRLCRLYQCTADSLLWEPGESIPGRTLPFPSAVVERVTALNNSQREAVSKALEQMLNLMDPGPPRPTDSPPSAVSTHDFAGLPGKPVAGKRKTTQQAP